MCPPVLLFLPGLPIFFHSSQEPVYWRAKNDRHKEENNSQLPPPDGKDRLAGQRSQEQWNQDAEKSYIHAQMLVVEVMTTIKSHSRRTTAIL